MLSFSNSITATFGKYSDSIRKAHNRQGHRHRNLLAGITGLHVVWKSRECAYALTFHHKVLHTDFSYFQRKKAAHGIDYGADPLGFLIFTAPSSFSDESSGRRNGVCKSVCEVSEIDRRVKEFVSLVVASCRRSQRVVARFALDKQHVEKGLPRFQQTRTCLGQYNHDQNRIGAQARSALRAILLDPFPEFERGRPRERGH